MSAVLNEEEFPKPLVRNGCFQLPWRDINGELAVRPGAASVAYAFITEKERPEVPSSKELDEIPEMQILTPDQQKLLEPPVGQIQVTWLGHACFLVQMGGMNILFDPVFYETIGPLSFAGQTRFRRCPMKVTDLPEIDIICISHDHYDHCDWPSIKSLHRRFGTKIRWCLPLGLDDWLNKQICHDDVVALGFNWWDSKEVHAHRGNSDSDLSLHIECVPAQHWSLRGTGFSSGRITDVNVRLWSGWVVKSSNPGLSVYHAGDTGYCNIFKSIGKKHGPIDLALIPIGAYCPRNVLTFQHVNPEEAVLIHEDVKAGRSIGMHWGTFVLTREFYLEPPQKLKDALESKNIPQEQFQVLKHGETVAIASVNCCSKEPRDDQSFLVNGANIV